MSLSPDGTCWHVCPTEEPPSVEEMVEELQKENSELERISIERWKSNCGILIPFLHAIKEHEKITEICIRETHLDRDVVSVLNKLFMGRDWEDVKLIDCHFRASWCLTSLLMAMANTVASLTLDVSSNLEFNWDDCIWTIGNVLAVSSRLQELECDLFGCPRRVSPVTVAGFFNGLRANKTLVKLVIKGLNITERLQQPNNGQANALLEVVANAFRHSNAPLEYISLDEARLGQQSMEDLLTSLQHFSQLKALGLAEAYCSGCRFVALEPILRTTTLKTLRLQTMCRNRGKIDISSLMEYLKTNKTVTSLFLCSNKLDDDDTRQIVSMLLVNKTLEHLSLFRNSISDEGTVHFASHFSQMPGLQCLDLEGNHATRVGAEALLQSMEKVTNITWLEFSSRRNDISNSEQNILKDIKRKLEYYATLNAGGRRLLPGPQIHNDLASLGPPTYATVNPALWPYVLARVKGKDWIEPVPQNEDFDYANASLNVINHFVQHVMTMIFQQQRGAKDLVCEKKRHFANEGVAASTDAQQKKHRQHR